MQCRPPPLSTVLISLDSTRRTNFDDELALQSTGIDIPLLFICATEDDVLLPAMSAGMERHIPKMTRREVKAGHWALWQAKEAVNKHLEEWVEGVVFGGRSKL